MSNVSDGALLGKMEDDLLDAKNSTVLPHCPRKIKYVKNILNITLDKKQKTKKTKKQVSL